MLALPNYISKYTQLYSPVYDTNFLVFDMNKLGCVVVECSTEEQIYYVLEKVENSHNEWIHPRQFTIRGLYFISSILFPFPVHTCGLGTRPWPTCCTSYFIFLQKKNNKNYKNKEDKRPVRQYSQVVRVSASLCICSSVETRSTKIVE